MTKHPSKTLSMARFATLYQWDRIYGKDKSKKYLPFHAIFLLTSLLLTSCAEKQRQPAPIEMTPHERAAREEVSADPVAAANMISQYRREHALSAVQPDPILQKLAQAQANAMAARDQLSHVVDGNLAKRIEAANLREKTAVENVSAGYFSLADVIAGWRRSPAHNANLLDPQMRHIGIAAADAPGTRYKVYWALVMTD
ncbi:MAG TPA: CAP domain-containing protein [Methylocella sp.]|nr:CAP domain-containing protein [Methylocella sp.]